MVTALKIWGEEKGDWRRTRREPKGLMTTVTVPRDGHCIRKGSCPGGGAELEIGHDRNFPPPTHS